MDYRKLGDSFYVRMDRGDEVLSTILDICRQENVRSATFSGIGGCSDAEIQVFDQERGVFETERIEGMLELVSIMGNVISTEGGELSYHAHALFAYRDAEEHRIAAGHLKSTRVLYTAEIELRPVSGGIIGAKRDPETGTNFWDLQCN